MKKTIAALAICLFAAGTAHAAMPQTPNTITLDLLAEATAKLNNPPAENPAGTEQQNAQTPKDSPEPESSNTTAPNGTAPEQEAAHYQQERARQAFEERYDNHTASESA